MSPGASPYEPVAVDLRDYVDFSLEAATGRRVATTDVVAIDVVSLEPGQVIAARTLPGADALYVVLAGTAWVVTDEAEVTLQALQAVLIPAGVAHGVRNDAPDPLITQVIISPPDEAPPALHGPAATPDEALGAAPPSTLLDRLRRALGGDSD